MRPTLWMMAAVVAAMTAHSTAGMAQPQQDPLPGGASGKDVFCLQVGDLISGAYIGTYLQTDAGNWEERLKGAVFKLAEKKRDDVVVELLDAQRQASIQFDFVTRTIKLKLASATDPWKDRYVILNATKKANSTDCAKLAMAPTAPGKGPAAGTPPAQAFVIPPKTARKFPPGTAFKGQNGPACPIVGAPVGAFTCPNKFECAPAGGVCCQGAGSCQAGGICSVGGGACLTPGDPRLCPGGATGPGEHWQCPAGTECLTQAQGMARGLLGPWVGPGNWVCD